MRLSGSSSLSVLTLLSHISLFGIESGLIFVILPINFYSFYYKFIVPTGSKIIELFSSKESGEKGGEELQGDLLDCEALPKCESHTSDSD